MFKAKPAAAPKQPWAMQFLTRDYLIEGLLDADDTFTEASTMGDNYGGIYRFIYRELKNARIKPTGNLKTASESFSKWTLGSFDNLVAIIPNDETVQGISQDAYKNHKDPVAAVVYSGPYRVNGSVLANSQDGSLYQARWQLVPVRDAKIDNLLPGAALTGMQIPWLFLNAGMIHGFGQA